jgi:hypothetical protein
MQVYVQDPPSWQYNQILVRPWKRLAGFARVPLAAGGVTQVTVPVLFDDLAFYDQYMSYAIPPGNYTFRVGQSSADDVLTDALVLPRLV